MLYLLLGENTYKREQELAKIFDGTIPEIVDGEKLELRDLPDLFAGQTLFALERTIVITDLSANKLVWEQLESWLDRLDDTTTLVLAETALDKRTRTYKMLQKRAKLILCDFWKQNEAYEAKKWLDEEAKRQATTLSGALADEMIRRAMRPNASDGKLIIDQQRLATVLKQLAGVAVTMQHIDTVMAPDIHENIFTLLTAALDGDAPRVRSMTNNLSAEEDGYKALGLLLSQVVNLALLSTKGARSLDQVASDTGVSVYALRPLEPYARRLSQSDIQVIVSIFATVDTRVKRGAEPWSVIETGLQKIALS